MLAQENAACAAMLSLAAGMAASQLPSSQLGLEKSHVQDSFAASAEALLLHRTLTLTGQRSHAMSALSIVRAMLPSMRTHTALCLYERLVTAALLIHAIDELDSGSYAESSRSHEWGNSVQSYPSDQETMGIPTPPSSSISFEEPLADIDSLLSGLPEPALQLISLFETRLQPLVPHMLRSRSTIACEAWTSCIHPLLTAYTDGRMASASPPLLKASKSLPANARHSIIDLYFNLSPSSHAPPPIMESSPSLSSSSLHSTETATPGTAFNTTVSLSESCSLSPTSPCFLENDASVNLHCEMSDVSHTISPEELSQPPSNDNQQQISASEPPFLPESLCVQRILNGSNTVLEDADVDDASWDIKDGSAVSQISRNHLAAVEGDSFTITERTPAESENVAFEIDKEAADFPIDLIHGMAAAIKQNAPAPSHLQLLQTTSADTHVLSPNDLMHELLLSSRVLPQSKTQSHAIPSLPTASFPTTKTNENQPRQTESQISVDLKIVGAKAIVSPEDGTGARDVFCRVQVCGDDEQMQINPTHTHDATRAREFVTDFGELWSSVGENTGNESAGDESIDNQSAQASGAAVATDEVSVSG
ncbi:hypothetical protein HDU80_000240, partial [Chytriomyces hyalinus]